MVILKRHIPKRHLQIHRANKNKKSFIRGNKLVVDKIEYTASQLAEIEKREEGTEELINSNSDPPIPTQPLIFEFLEEKLPSSREKQTNLATRPL
ncbi:hypothetical protein JTB14_032046 [Gonioctena quinquepunctata]|nr:hypothetical protein JTB14_032046 [Gonioctena quinquepunctata]